MSNKWSVVVIETVPIKKRMMWLFVVLFYVGVLAAAIIGPQLYVRSIVDANGLGPALVEEPSRLPPLYANRESKRKVEAIREFGGTAESEAAVERALTWIVKQQKDDGRWMFDIAGPNKEKTTNENAIAATALGILPLLANGPTHQPHFGNRYATTIDKGLKYLAKAQDKDTGYFGGTMYSHALATIAVCEAYGMTKDSDLLDSARAAVKLIVDTQHENGGWRYEPAKTPQADMSVVGWQIAALKSAQAAGLNVPAVTIYRTKSIVEWLRAGDDEGYGYVAGAPSTPRMAAVGLMCRHHLENWGPTHPRLIKAIDTHIKPNGPDRTDVYYTYYATQVMFHFGGQDWQDWNAKMREFFIRTQDRDPKTATFGSWDAKADPWGHVGGRLLITSLNTLTLQVYYRHARSNVFAN